MSITKNWELHGDDGNWQVLAKPTELGSSKIELSIAHSGPKPGPTMRGQTVEGRSMVGIKKLVAEVEIVAEITELADLLHTLADAVRVEQN